MNLEDEKTIERAIRFAAEVIRSDGGKEKPVLLHSARVGVYLQNGEYSAIVVAAGFLHDVLENSDVSPKRIEEEFGPEVAKLVKANTHDEAISDKTEQYKEMFARCKQAGPDALAIKAADLLDNTRYFEQAVAQKRKLQLEKIRYFLDLSAGSLAGVGGRGLGDRDPMQGPTPDPQPLTPGEAVWRDLSERYLALAERDQSEV